MGNNHVRVEKILPDKMGGMDDVRHVDDLEHLGCEEAQARFTCLKSVFFSSEAPEYRPQISTQNKDT